MDKEFTAFESKISQVAALCRSLRTENTQLRQALAAAEADKKTLSERMDLARERLEMLAQQLPAAKLPIE